MGANRPRVDGALDGTFSRPRDAQGDIRRRNLGERDAEISRECRIRGSGHSESPRYIRLRLRGELFIAGSADIL